MEKPKDSYFSGCRLTTCLSKGESDVFASISIMLAYGVVFIIIIITIIIIYIKSTFLVSFEKYNRTD